MNISECGRPGRPGRSKRRMAGRSGLLRHRQAPDVAAPGDGRTPFGCGFSALCPLRLREFHRSVRTISTVAVRRQKSMRLPIRLVRGPVGNSDRQLLRTEPGK